MFVLVKSHLYSASFKLQIHTFCKQHIKLKDSAFLPIPLCFTRISFSFYMPVLFISTGISGCAAGNILEKLVCCALCVSLGRPQFVEYRSDIHLTSVLIHHGYITQIILKKTCIILLFCFII